MTKPKIVELHTGPVDAEEAMEQLKEFLEELFDIAKPPDLGVSVRDGVRTEDRVG